MIPSFNVKTYLKTLKLEQLNEVNMGTLNYFAQLNPILAKTALKQSKLTWLGMLSMMQHLT